MERQHVFGRTISSSLSEFALLGKLSFEYLLLQIYWRLYDNSLLKNKQLLNREHTSSAQYSLSVVCN